MLRRFRSILARLQLILVAFVLLVLATAPAPGDVRQRAALAGSQRRLAVAWDDFEQDTSFLQLMSAEAPWAFEGSPVTVGSGAILHLAGGRIYAVSRAAGSLAVFEADDLTPVDTYDLGETCQPADVAVVGSSHAYVSCSAGTHLMRLDLGNGQTSDVVDLSPFADADGIPDMNLMAAHAGRLFVQLLRVDNINGGFALPPYLAVFDIATEKLVDADPVAPGVQAIALEGTPPKFKMQVMPEEQQLFVSASGGFFDEGGIEIVDLASLQSLGLAIAEADGETAADLGAFVMIDSDAGYLVFSTDFALSSHLHAFSVQNGVDPVEHHVQLNYFVPVLVHNPQTDSLFWPEGGGVLNGVLVFNALTGERLTRDPVATSGPPSDMILVCPGPQGCEGAGAVPAVSFAGLAAAAAALLAAGAAITARRRCSVAELGLADQRPPRGVSGARSERLSDIVRADC
jgi:hypothetical protein